MKNNLIRLVISNIFYLAMVVGTNFLVPMFTSVETYAAVKEYTLYLTTYSGIMTFGYIQGMYLEYGGKDIKQIDPSNLGSSVFSFFVFQLPISLVVSLAGLLSNNFVLSVVGIGFLSSNLVAYYQMFYQATGDFKAYGIALNASRVLMLPAYCALIFGLKTDSKLLFVAIAPIVGVTTAVYLTIRLNRTFPFWRYLRFRFSQITNNTRGGFVLMLGNFATSFFSSIDRWFVNYLLDTFSFAAYSFAVSMENVINTLMAPITVSMYHYMCKNQEINAIRKIKDRTLIYGFVIIAIAFPAKWLLVHFVQKYSQAVSVMFYLFAAQAVAAIIRGIYVNKYKAEGMQKKYLLQMVLVVIVAVVLNGVMIAAFHRMEAIAVATLLTNLIWLIVCEAENPQIRFEKEAVLSMVILLAVYIYAGSCLNAMAGLLIYGVAGITIGLTLMREQFLYVLRFVIDSLVSLMKKRENK